MEKKATITLITTENEISGNKSKNILFKTLGVIFYSSLVR